MLKEVKDRKVARGYSSNVVHAACVYIASRQQGIERSIRLLCGAAEGTTEREIGRVCTKILESSEAIKAEMAQKHFRGEQVVPGLITTLALPPEFSRASRELTRCYYTLVGDVQRGVEHTSLAAAAGHRRYRGRVAGAAAARRRALGIGGPVTCLQPGG